VGLADPRGAGALGDGGGVSGAARR
jgi:hypothetical protein